MQKNMVYFEKNGEEYKKRIIEMIEKIDNQKSLEYICTFIKLFLEKWGD